MVFKQKGNDFYIKKRGRHSSQKIINGYTFFHSLLPITGEFSPQPYEKDGIVAIYNGEIYNQKFLKSDGEVLIPLYLKYGYDFVEHLDGEWAIAIYDFNKGIALFSTDFFGTKPIWINGTECASYQSGVGGQKLEANKIIVKDLSTEQTVFTKKIHEFDFDNQHKDYYEDWIAAFERAVTKRIVPGCFVGLSSGYDSGAIVCAIRKTGIKHTSYSVVGSENAETIIQRKPTHILNIDLEEYQKLESEIRERVEDYKYKRAIGSVVTDKASVGLAKICKLALADKCKVYLSGQGADEIIGDYKFWSNQNDFNGVFPEKLKEWTNFTGGTQEDYLMKEEYIAGSYGMETRYPFLDTEVVQEFLWLMPELKNKNYKAPLYQYLTRNKFPFDENVKKGFRPLTKL